MAAKDLMPDLEQRAGEQVRKLAIDAFSGIVLKTPVDTGRARGNWTVKVAGGGRTSPGIDKSGSATIAAGSQAIAGGDGIPAVITIANNLPYIEPLENGHSGQAPAGMVAVTLARLGLSR